MRTFLLRWLLLAVAFVLTVALVPGMDVDWQPGTYLLLSALFGLVDALLGPILRLLSLPVRVMTLGLFALVVNGFLLVVTAWLSDALQIDGFLTAICGALVLSIATAVLHVLIKPDRRGKARRAA